MNKPRYLERRRRLHAFKLNSYSAKRSGSGRRYKVGCGRSWRTLLSSAGATIDHVLQMSTLSVIFESFEPVNCNFLYKYYFEVATFQSNRTFHTYDVIFPLQNLEAFSKFQLKNSLPQTLVVLLLRLMLSYEDPENIKIIKHRRELVRIYPPDLSAEGAGEG